MSELASDSGLFEHVWPVYARSFVRSPLYRWRTLRRVRGAGFETVIEPTYSRDFLRGDAVAAASGAPQRIGAVGDNANRTALLGGLGRRAYTQLMPVRAGERGEIAHNCDFARAMGADSSCDGLPRLPEPAGRLPGFVTGDYYVLIPGAASAYRRWPADRVARLADQIFEATGWTGVVCGSTAEQPIAADVIRQGGARLEDWTGRTSVRELSAILAGARLVVANETGPAHIAAAHRTPTVIIAGGGHYGRFVPYETSPHTDEPQPVIAAYEMPCFGCNWRCVYSVERDAPRPCIMNVTAESVWESVQALLPQSEAIRR